MSPAKTVGAVETASNRRYTTAPANYDGGLTKTVRIVGTLSGKPLREVSIDEEDLDWQAGRYASGMYECWTDRDLAIVGDMVKAVA